jgi:hypothetical protein
MGLNPGCSIFLQGINLTKTVQIEALTLVGNWQGKLHGIAAKTRRVDFDWEKFPSSARC